MIKEGLPDAVPDEGAGGRLWRGKVVDLLPQGKFRVELADNQMILAHTAATAERNFMRLRVGDEVEVVLSPHDATRGRIMKVVKTI